MTQKTTEVERMNSSLIPSSCTAALGSCREQMTQHHQHNGAQRAGVLLIAWPHCCQSTGDVPEPAASEELLPVWPWLLGLSARAFPQPLSKAVAALLHLLVPKMSTQTSSALLTTATPELATALPGNKRETSWRANGYPWLSVPSRFSSMLTSASYPAVQLYSAGFCCF